MDRQVLKGMVLMLKQVVTELEAEVFSDKEAYVPKQPATMKQDYELYDDDDGYSDQRENSKTAFKEFWQYSYKSFDLRMCR